MVVNCHYVSMLFVPIMCSLCKVFLSFVLLVNLQDKPKERLRKYRMLDKDTLSWRKYFPLVFYVLLCAFFRDLTL